MKLRSSFLLLVLTLGCSDSHPGSMMCASYDPPCGAGQIEWTDEVCFDNDAAPEDRCSPRGDGLCYELCEVDADCADPCRPHCSEIAFYRGSPFACVPPGEVMRVCKEDAAGFCDL